MPPLTAVALEHDCQPHHDISSFGYIKSKIAPLFETKKRVRFAMTDMVYPHIHFKDISNQEKALAWMTRHDEISTREHIDFTVMLMQEGEDIPQYDYCSRGLEYMIDSNEYHERVQRGKKAVMGVQEFLRHSSSHDEDLETEIQSTV